MSWIAPTLEPSKKGRPAVRLGLNNINGMEREAAWRIEEAWAARALESARDLAMRADLSAARMKALASASAGKPIRQSPLSDVECRSKRSDKGLVSLLMNVMSLTLPA